MKQFKLKNLVFWGSTVVLLVVWLSCNLFGGKDDNKDQQAAAALLLGSANVVPATGPGCDRTKEECVKSLIGNKKWIMKGSQQVPRNPLGWTVALQDSSATFCINKTVVDINSSATSLTTTTTTGTVSPCNKDQANNQGTPFTANSVTIKPVSSECFDITLDYGTFQQKGRGNINSDGTLLKLELYNVNSTTTPAGMNCSDGAVGERNASLTPDNDSCNSSFFVCNPPSDPDYNAVQTYDLTD